MIVDISQNLVSYSSLFSLPFFHSFPVFPRSLLIALLQVSVLSIVLVFLDRLISAFVFNPKVGALA
jgi:hypothetical protein